MPRLPLNNEALIDATARIKEQLAAQGVSAA